MMIDFECLRDWFIMQARDLPWRNNPTPYRVWISEVMLQQTRAIVVIPYFERWMTHLPTIEALATSPLEEVIKLWEGLGYYARARHLHEAAREIVQLYRGNLPIAEEQLIKIKGLGPYTIGAIRSFAFHQKAAAVDGNVARVLSRLFLIEEEINLLKVQKQLREMVLSLLPDFEPWVIMEALIELGAQICEKKPRCLECPLQSQCLAYQRGCEEKLPKRSKRFKTTLLERTVAIIAYQTEVLVKKEEKNKVMRGLYEFPYFEGKEIPFERIPCSLSFVREFSQVTHTFTRYRAFLFPALWQAEKRVEVEGFQWVKKTHLSALAFSAGHRRILNEYLKEER